MNTSKQLISLPLSVIGLFLAIRPVAALTQECVQQVDQGNLPDRRDGGCPTAIEEDWLYQVAGQLQASR